MYKKGDIVVIPVPFTDNKSFKRRPALVISNDDVHKTGDVMIVQITSTIKSDYLSFELSSNDLTINLPKQSFVRLHKIFILEEKLIEKKISEVTPNSYKIIADKITKIIM